LKGIADTILDDVVHVEGVHIRDYKTKKMYLDVIHSFQILLNSATLEIMGNSPKGASIGFIKQQENMAIPITPELIIDAIDNADAIVQKILHNSYYRNNKHKTYKKIGVTTIPFVKQTIIEKKTQINKIYRCSNNFVTLNPVID
jgi:hypothetical protein